MAIFNAVPPPEELTGGLTSSPPTTNAAAPAVDIDAWTASALQSLSVSPVARGVGTSLVIPIDIDAPPPPPRRVALDAPAAGNDEGVLPCRPPSRRDSMKRREALLRGNEGSRQRRRWENDRLVGVPNVQPPLPADWEIRPTHRVCRVPYQVAQFWDRGIRQQVEDKTTRLQAARKKQQLSSGSATGLGVGQVPRDLREMAKRTPVVRDWVRALEEPVRRFLSQDQERSSGDISGESDLDSDDDEIVFVGRHGAMRELREKKEARCRRARREVSHETVDSGLVFDSFGHGESAAFKRWLTHSISDYYGLASRSVTPADSSCRVVYVGLKQTHTRPGLALHHPPRPLWECC